VNDDEEDDEEREASPKAVGHNIYILATQVLIYVLVLIL
jgi:hypothetical protein